MKQVIGFLFLLLGALFLFRVLVSGWFLFLLLALALAVGAATGAVGRWGYCAAVLLLLLGLPGLLFSSLSLVFAILMKLAPVLLLLFGVYLLVNR